MTEEDRRRLSLAGKRGAIERWGGDPAVAAELDRQIAAARVLAAVRRILAECPRLTTEERGVLCEIASKAGMP